MKPLPLAFAFLMLSCQPTNQTHQEALSSSIHKNIDIALTKTKGSSYYLSKEAIHRDSINHLKFNFTFANSNIECRRLLESDSVDIAVVDKMQYDELQNRKTPLSVIDTLSSSWGLVCSQESGIKDIHSLPYHTIAAPYHSTAYTSMLKTISDAKIKLEQIAFVRMDNSEVMLKMLKKNQIDGILIPEPYLSKALEQLGQKKALISIPDNKEYIVCKAERLDSLTQSIKLLKSR